MLLMFVNHIHRTVCGLFLMMASVVVFAQAESAPQKADTPHEMVELVTEQLLSLVRKYNDGEVDTEPILPNSSKRWSQWWILITSHGWSWDPTAKMPPMSRLRTLPKCFAGDWCAPIPEALLAMWTATLRWRRPRTMWPKNGV